LGNEKRSNKEVYFFTLRLSPESYEIYLWAGLLACLVLVAFPFRSIGTVTFLYQKMNRLTATGIAPEFNRIPFLIPKFGNQQMRQQRNANNLKLTIFSMNKWIYVSTSNELTTFAFIKC
jgi:hypothetical protein